jgi:hypothetical protein
MQATIESEKERMRFMGTNSLEHISDGPVGIDAGPSLLCMSLRARLDLLSVETPFGECSCEERLQLQTSQKLRGSNGRIPNAFCFRRYFLPTRLTRVKSL